jgi:hypothetical protein
VRKAGRPRAIRRDQLGGPGLDDLLLVWCGFLCQKIGFGEQCGVCHVLHDAANLPIFVLWPNDASRLKPSSPGLQNTAISPGHGEVSTAINARGEERTVGVLIRVNWDLEKRTRLIVEDIPCRTTSFGRR